VVTRADLPPGAQAAQAIHAAVAYGRDFGDHLPPGETVVFLAARDELELCWLVSRLREEDVFYSAFREPDLDHSLTAIAVGSGGASACRKYRLALERKLT
jgi:hypothetical protein